MKLRVLAYVIFVSVFILALTLLGNRELFAGDITGSSDHRLLKRYKGSGIKKYDQREFDEYVLLLGEVKDAPSEPNKVKIAKSEKLEGKVTKISYEIPQDRSSLEVLRNYEDELKSAGFEILFACSNKECGGRAFNHTVVPYDMMFGDNYYDQRYLAAKLSRSEGDVYASVYVIKNTTGGGRTKNYIYTQVDVIELVPMQEQMVKIDAEEMAKEIMSSGSVSIYGIYFDFDKADIKPESEPTIAEIAKFLKEQPDLKVFIVGHTDNEGSLEYNIDLSKQRAKSVVSKLINDHGIEPSRLIPEGLGFLAPVASNRTEEGRAKNRRVELVEF
jgi:OmpA-OmpF porin, OOP family